jgi:hypothetical protein
MREAAPADGRSLINRSPTSQVQISPAWSDAPPHRARLRPLARMIPQISRQGPFICASALR